MSVPVAPFYCLFCAKVTNSHNVNITVSPVSTYGCVGGECDECGQHKVEIHRVSYKRMTLAQVHISVADVLLYYHHFIDDPNGGFIFNILYESLIPILANLETPFLDGVMTHGANGPVG